MLGIYLLFTLAAGARSAVQISTRFPQAPLAYLFSAGAALTYLAATLLIRAVLAGRELRQWLVAVSIAEFLGVLTVGTASRLAPEAFPDATVWSHYGSGYGFLPAVLPLAALLWAGAIRRAEQS